MEIPFFDPVRSPFLSLLTVFICLLFYSFFSRRRAFFGCSETSRYASPGTRVVMGHLSVQLDPMMWI